LHVFPFSPREGTPAARMPQLDRRLVKDRAARLRQKGDEAYLRHLDRLAGSRQRVLVENEGSGRAEDFTPVAISGSETGAIVDFDVSGHDGMRLTGATVHELESLEA